MERILTVAVLVVAVATVTTPVAAAASPAAASTGVDAPSDPAAFDAGDGPVAASHSEADANESLSVDDEDGLNDSELQAVVDRAMVRVEQVRDLEFEEEVPVEVISRSEHERRTEERYENTTAHDRIHQNVKFESLFVVDKETDAMEELRGTTSGAVKGYYDIEENQIVVVSENDENPRIDELTLGHELVHALQDQHYNLSRYNQTTEERSNAVNGIVEGDAVYVENLYEQRCDDEWECHSDDDGGAGSPGVNVGILILRFQPYSDGPVFVEEIKEAGGWEAVNDVYDDPPASTSQVIHTEKYPDERPRELSVEDRSSDSWGVLELPDGPLDYAEFGETGLFTMFMFPTFEQRSRVIIGQNEFVTGQQGMNQYDYAHEASDGWDGDRLYPYVNGDPEDDPETGYVWQIAWENDGEAEEFVGYYERLLDYRNAERVAGHLDTWRIEPGEHAKEFGGTYYVDRNGDTVTIVHGPTVEDVQNIREGAAPEGETETPEPTPSPTETPDDGTSSDPTDDGTDGTPSAPTDDGDAELPGFGAVAALVAVLVAALLVRRR